MWEAIALSFGLAMDAAAVSAARGFANRGRELVILPLAFGGAQAAMSALGWLGGAWAGKYLDGVDFWIAFGLLVLLGGKMIVEALRASEDEEPEPGTPAVYAGLAIATSIDAAAAGLTLPLLPVDPAIALALIGGVTAACSALGFVVGRTLGKHLGKRLEVAGGVVLVLLGVRFLVIGLRG